MARSGKESGMGQIDPYQNKKPPYIVHMHIAQDHAANLHGRRQHTCGTVKGERGWQTTLRYRVLSYTVASIANVATPSLPVFASVQRHFREASLIPSESTTQEDNIIENKKKEEVIRFKTTTDHKAKIERAAEKRGLTVSEYLRQSVNAKMSRDRPMDWYPTIERLETICAGADGDTRAALIDLIRSLYKGGA